MESPGFGRQPKTAMKTHTITMPQEEAERRLAAALSIRHADSREYAGQLARAYKAMTEGRPLLSLSRSMEAAGRFYDGRPRLAIARADRPEVYFWQAAKAPVGRFITAQNRSVWSGRRYPTLDISVRMDEIDRSVDGYALVPQVPPEVRPATGQLRDWFILWEVEEWYEQPQHMTAPTDPFLLRHIGGDLYEVLAEWDLTEVEKMVLEGAMSF